MVKSHPNASIELIQLGIRIYEIQQSCRLFRTSTSRQLLFFFSLRFWLLKYLKVNLLLVRGKHVIHVRPFRVIPKHRNIYFNEAFAIRERHSQHTLRPNLDSIHSLATILLSDQSIIKERYIRCLVCTRLLLLWSSIANKMLFNLCTFMIRG